MKNQTGIKRDYIPQWEKNLSRILEILILLSGLLQTLAGETSVGIMILISFVAITFPDIWSRGKIRTFPIEVKLLLFVMVVLQLILGEVHDFYTEIPYYDKITHFFLPLFTGFIAFLIFYSMIATGNLKINMSFLVVVIILITLGIGSLWEIFEYTSDQLIYPKVPGWHHFQGNAQQDAHTDTMTDLIDDTLGGIFGALLCIWFVGRLETKNSRRLNILVHEMTPELVTAHKVSKKKKSAR